MAPNCNVIYELLCRCCVLGVILSHLVITLCWIYGFILKLLKVLCFYLDHNINDAVIFVMASMPLTNEMDMPSEAAFRCLQSLNFDQLLTLMSQQSVSIVQPILPCLARMYFCQSLDDSSKWKENRKKLIKLLLPFPVVNEMPALIEIDYGPLEVDVKRELTYRLKTASTASLAEGSSFLTSISMPDGLFYCFERSQEPREKLRIVLHELIGLMAHVRNYSHTLNQPNSSPYQSDLFDDEGNVEEVVLLIYISICEMSSTFQLLEVVEALLALKEGLRLICRLVANFPDSFHEVCSSLIINCEKGDEQHGFYSANRVKVLRQLCRMNKTEALLIRAEAVEQCRMANLVIMLTLDHIQQIEKDRLQVNNAQANEENDMAEDLIESLQSKTDVIAFLLGILMSNDERVRTWFAHNIKPPKEKNPNHHNIHHPMHSHSSAIFGELRMALLEHFKLVYKGILTLQDDQQGHIGETQSKLLLTQACLMLRLYCALRGVAGIKFNEEEAAVIARLIICRPPHNYSGVRFVTFGLCMILAFPQLVTMGDNEGRMVNWIKWLVQEESYFGKSSNSNSSFGEMLLLIAIHFHSNQLSAIGELISTTIGIKLPIQTNELNRIKHIFTHEIFTDQTVTAHAIKVPVTKNLNSSISGFLSVHCIYQLLKSRAFSKHRVQIKDWILRQIRQCVAPIHPMVPLLLEAYVHSILVPNVLSGLVLTNEPLTETEIRAIFEKKVYSIENDNEDGADGTSAENMDVDKTDSDSDIIENNSEEENEDEVVIKLSDDDSNSEDGLACVLTSQLLVLYYVLLYEDVRIANRKNQVNSSSTNNVNLLMVEKKAMTYSSHLFSQLPIFYLVQRTRAMQREYGVLMAPLLRLLAYHYPHLCLVKDWLPLNYISQSIKISAKFSTSFERQRFNQAFETFGRRDGGNVNFYRMTRACEMLLRLPDEHLWPLLDDFIAKLPLLLEDQIPKMLAINMRNIWFRLNRIFPTKLWLVTVNRLEQDRHKVGKHFTLTNSWKDLMKDPMIVLRLDKRVFRTPELMEIVLHMLNGFLLAAKIYRAAFLVEHPIRLATGAPASERNELEKRRENMKVEYQALTEAIAIQILLECCLLKESDFGDASLTRFFNGNGSPEDSSEDNTDMPWVHSNNNPALILKRRRSAHAQRFTGSGSRVGEGNFLSNLHEVQGLICNHIHQCFIADPNIAKLVHFEGYHREVLPLVVAGVPSMHICADFIPELLDPNQTLEKHSFAIDLCSHLCVQYPILRFMNLAELCLAVAEVHLTLLPSEKRANFYLSILPALERIGKVFPPLIEHIVRVLVLLLQRNGFTLADRMKVEDPFHWIPETVKLVDPEALEKDEYELGATKEGEPLEQLITTNLIDLEWGVFEKMMRRRKLAPEQAMLITGYKVFGMLCRHHTVEKIFSDESLEY